MRTFRFLLARARRDLFLTTVVMTLSGLASSGLILLINRTLTAAQLPSLAVFAGFVALAAAVVASRTLGSYLLSRVMSRSLFQLRMDLGRRLLQVPHRQFELIGPDKALSALTSDISTVNGVLGGFPFFFRNLVVVLCCLAYLLVVSWQCFLVVTAFIVLGLSLYRLVVRRAKHHQKASRQEWDRLFGFFRGLVSGIKELKINAAKRSDFIGHMLEPSEKAFQRHHLLGSTFFTAAGSISQTLTFLMIGVVLFALPPLLGIPHEVQISYTLLLLYMMGPFENIVSWIPNLMNADIAMGRVEALGVSIAGAAGPAATAIQRAPSRWAEIRLERVVHTYHRENEPGEFRLGPVSLRLRRGEITLVVGGNGSGKTTLAKLITGLYPPEGGRILLDDTCISPDLAEDYRQNFAAIFSDYHLFEQLLGLPSYDADAAGRYLQRLQLDHKVRIQDGAFSDTCLSQGQRKRLALLASYLEDRPVYLFDEWAADQDPQFKEVFYRELLPELKVRGKTVVVISHDERYFDVADQLIKLENGTVVAQAAPQLEPAM